MKKSFLLSVLTGLVMGIFAQTPDGISYQAVVRDGTGQIFAIQNLVLQISILQGSTTGAVIYAENHPVTTNSFGLVNVVIGEGEVLSGDFDAINWANGLFFLKTAVDYDGNGNFQELGVSQFYSVPYSRFADVAGAVPKMTSAEREAIQNPSVGMQIYNLTTNCLNYFNGTAWYEDCGTLVVNQPPSAPINPFPPNNSTDQLLHIDFSWECTDPENDTLFYDFYLGNSNPPPLHTAGLTENHLLLVELQHSSTFFWKIVAHDERQNTSVGNIWTFETIDCITPFVSLGYPLLACDNPGNLLLDYIYAENYESIQWFSSGDGTFDDPSLLEPHYYFGELDVLNGTVNLTVVAYSNPECNLFHTADAELIISKGPSVTAGPDALGCMDSFEGIPISATAENTPWIKWITTNGTGFIDDENILNANYYPGQEDFENEPISIHILAYPNFPCEVNAEDSLNLYFDHVEADAGPNQYNLPVNTTTLQGNNPPEGGYGVWTIINGAGGTITEPGNPSSAFSGIEGTIYTLRWTVFSSIGCSEHDQVQIIFGCVVPPTTANAGPDQTNISFGSIFLQGNIPVVGTGNWTIVSGDGGTISDPTSPSSEFTGTPGATFVLQWTIADTCSSSSDEVTLAFSNWICGMELIDTRDSQVYPTVKVAHQCWMAKNMNVGQQLTPPTFQTDNGIIEKYCYSNNPNNCDVYGGLYLWNEMMQFATTEGAQGICPTGWHIPSDAEFGTLALYLGTRTIAGGNMKETGTLLWEPPNTGATNSSGFSGIPGGFFSLVDNYLGQGLHADFWTSSGQSQNLFRYKKLFTDSISIYTGNEQNAWLTAMSVRCVKETPPPANQPPDELWNISPNGYNIAIAPTLTWQCNDPEGDPVTFDVYFGTTSDPPLVATGLTQTTYSPGTLNYYTKYYWKILARDNHLNATEGEVWNFTTVPELPVVTTNAVTNITAVSVTTGGNVTSGGSSAVTARGVCWSTTQNPTTTNSHTYNGSGTGAFTGNINYLVSNTTYYVRAYATNANGTAYGNQRSFTTSVVTCPVSFTDSRDGKVYTTVVIGGQCWMNQNLNVGTRISGQSNQTNNGTIEKYCYSNSESICTTYGGLYQWNEMMQYSTTPGTKGICPSGWHLPTNDDFDFLKNYVGNQPSYLCNSNTSYIAKSLASKTYWSISSVTCAVGNNLSTNNSTGFSVLPGGLSAATFQDMGASGRFWASSEVNDDISSSLNFSYNWAYADNFFLATYKWGGLSVRCLKD